MLWLWCFWRNTTESAFSWASKFERRETVSLNITSESCCGRKSEVALRLAVMPAIVWDGQGMEKELETGTVGITAWFLYRAGAETPPKLSRKFPSFSQNDLEKILSGGYPNRSSGIRCWGLDLSGGYLNTYSSWFSGYTQLTLVFLPRDKNFRLFSWGACHKIRVSAPAPYKNPTVTEQNFQEPNSELESRNFCREPKSELRKSVVFIKFSARNSGAGNGCANFMGAWHFLVLSAGNPSCP